MIHERGFAGTSAAKNGHQIQLAATAGAKELQRWAFHFQCELQITGGFCFILVAVEQ